MGKEKTEGGAGGNDPKSQGTPPADPPKATSDPPGAPAGNPVDIAKAVAEALPGALDALVKSGQLLGGDDSGGKASGGEGGVFDIDAAVERALGRRQQAQADDQHRQTVNTRLEKLERGPEPKPKPWHHILDPWRW